MSKRSKYKTVKANTHAEDANTAAMHIRTVQQSSAPLSILHQTVGNQAVGRLIRQSRVKSQESKVGSQGSGAIQPKLSINRPNDIYEQEADRVAAQVMRTPGTTPERQSRAEAAEKVRPQRQASAHDASIAEAPPIVHEALRTSGQPLDTQTRAFFEPRFGHDFSQVRVHADTKAAESAKAVSAKAYTVGGHIAFAQCHYQPTTQQGRELLAHELIHVVQQREGPVPARLEVGRSESGLEREANRVAWRAGAVHDTRSQSGLQLGSVPCYSPYDPGSRAGSRLLAHEEVHTQQQCGAAMPAGPLDVSSPRSAEGVEADRAAEGHGPAPSQIATAKVQRQTDPFAATAIHLPGEEMEAECTIPYDANDLTTQHIIAQLSTIHNEFIMAYENVKDQLREQERAAGAASGSLLNLVVDVAFEFVPGGAIAGRLGGGHLAEAVVKALIRVGKWEAKKYLSSFLATPRLSAEASWLELVGVAALLGFEAMQKELGCHTKDELAALEQALDTSRTDFLLWFEQQLQDVVSRFHAQVDSIGWEIGAMPVILGTSQPITRPYRIIGLVGETRLALLDVTAPSPNVGSFDWDYRFIRWIDPDMRVHAEARAVEIFGGVGFIDHAVVRDLPSGLRTDDDVEREARERAEEERLAVQYQNEVTQTWASIGSISGMGYLTLGIMLTDYILRNPQPQTSEGVDKAGQVRQILEAILQALPEVREVDDASRFGQLVYDNTIHSTSIRGINPPDLQPGTLRAVREHIDMVPRVTAGTEGTARIHPDWFSGE